MNIVIEDWVLQKELFPKAGLDAGTNKQYTSYEYNQEVIRLVGTKKQIRDWSAKQDFILDEVYSYEPFDKDHTYFKDICFSDKYDHLPTRDEYNKKYYQDLKEYTNKYKENENKLLIL